MLLVRFTSLVVYGCESRGGALSAGINNLPGPNPRERSWQEYHSIHQFAATT